MTCWMFDGLGEIIDSTTYILFQLINVNVTERLNKIILLFLFYYGV